MGQVGRQGQGRDKVCLNKQLRTLYVRWAVVRQCQAQVKGTFPLVLTPKMGVRAVKICGISNLLLWLLL